MEDLIYMDNESTHPNRESLSLKMNSENGGNDPYNCRKSNKIDSDVTKVKVANAAMNPPNPPIKNVRKTNNYDIESDGESIVRSKELLEPAKLNIKSIISNSISRIREEKYVLVVTAGVKVADFLHYMDEKKADMNVHLADMKKNIQVKLKRSTSKASAKNQEEPDDSYELCDEVQDVTSTKTPQSGGPKLQIDSDRLKRLFEPPKINLKIPKPSPRKPVSKEVNKPSTSRELPRTLISNNNRSFSGSRINRIQKPLPPLLPTKNEPEPDENDYEYDQFPEDKGDVYVNPDDDAYDEFTGEINYQSRSPPSRNQPSMNDGDNLYYNSDVIQRAKEEPPPIPPKKKNQNSSVEKGQVDRQLRPKSTNLIKISSNKTDFELPRRSVCQEKEKRGLKGIMKLGLKIPHKAEMREGEAAKRIEMDHSKRLHPKQEEKPVVLTSDFRYPDANEYELCESPNSPVEIQYSQSAKVGGKAQVENSVTLRRNLPEIPKLIVESPPPRGSNTGNNTNRCSVTKIPKSTANEAKNEVSRNSQNDVSKFGQRDQPRGSSVNTNKDSVTEKSQKPPMPIIPARPKYIPQHIASQFSTQTVSNTTYLPEEKEEPFIKSNQIDPEPEGSKSFAKTNEPPKEETVQNKEQDEDGCDNDVYMLMSECYSGAVL